MRIIAVDDELGSLSLFLGEVVEESDIDCRFFTGKVNEIVEFCRSSPDLKAAFLDVNMAEISGIDLAERIIRVRPDIKIVFVTGTNATLDGLPPHVRENTLEIIYKPITRTALRKVFAEIEEKPPVMVVRTFGGFDCFIGRELVNFSSAKSKELFALLIVYRGRSVSMNQIISLLWPDKDLGRAKKLYRDAVWRLRATLSSVNFNCVNFGRAQLSLDLSNIQCDYYDFMSHKEGTYVGDFLPSYDWSFDLQMEIDNLKEKWSNS